MTKLTIEVPDEAAEIADLQERLKLFICEQVEIDRWRKRRYSPGVSDLVDEAFTEAERLKKDGMTAEQSREEMIQQWREFQNEGSSGS